MNSIIGILMLVSFFFLLTVIMAKDIGVKGAVTVWVTALVVLAWIFISVYLITS